MVGLNEFGRRLERLEWALPEKAQPDLLVFKDEQAYQRWLAANPDERVAPKAYIGIDLERV